MIKSTKVKFLRPLLLLIFFALFFCLSGCGGGKDEATAGTNTDTTTTAAYLNLSASSTTVKTDNGATKTTITVTALNSAHAVLPDVTITMSADTGVLDSATITTGSDGTATVKFYCDSNPINRTATITATAGNVSASTLIQIVGSTITLNPTGTIGLSASGSPTVTLTAIVSDAGGYLVRNTPVTITKTGTGNVTITPASGQTDSSGQFTTVIAGVTDGSVTLTVTAAGAMATKAIIVSTSVAAFGIDKQWLNGTDIGNPKPTAMKISDQLTIEVNAPTSATTIVLFATTLGTFTDPADATNTGNAIPITVSGGKATAILTTDKAGIANVQVLDKTTPATNDSITVAMTSSLGANSIVLQAKPIVVPKSVGSTTGTSILIATVRDATLPTGVLVAGVPISFSILNPTGGGETIYPVVVMTGTDGTASTTFSSGSVSSDPAGVQIRASAVGTTVATGTAPSGADASITIGGTAGSVAFGQATVISEYLQSNYSYPMSVLVADSSGHAMANAVVSLKLWPIAWSTGVNCTPDNDGSRCNYNLYPIECVYGDRYGTFWSEDANANLILDYGEDGRRIFYATGVTATEPAHLDGLLTPVNSDGGALPVDNISTDANGVAPFKLIYPKASALWTIVRIRASTVVQGSETVGEIIFRLPAMIGDVTYWSDGSVRSCALQDSHYIY